MTLPRCACCRTPHPRSEVPPQLQHCSRLVQLRFKQQQPAASALALAHNAGIYCLPYSHARDLPAFLLEMPWLNVLEVGQRGRCLLRAGAPCTHGCCCRRRQQALEAVLAGC